MNANELAVLLDNTKFTLCHKAATMLRQQEVEIERVVSKYEEMIRKQQAEIEALKLAKKVILRYAEEDIAKYKAEIVLLNQVTSKKLK